MGHSNPLCWLTEVKVNTNSVCVCFGAACGDMLIGSWYSIYKYKYNYKHKYKYKSTNTNSVCVCVCFGAACGDMLIGSGYSIASLTIAEITEKGINPW